MFFPCIIPFLRVWRTGGAAVATILAFGCGGGTPTAPVAPAAFGLTCPSNVNASSLGGIPVEVNFGEPVTHGGTAPVSITCSPAAGAVFPAGASAVSCTAVDATGRSTTCGFTVNVQAIPRLSRTTFMTFGDSLTEGKLGLSVLLLVDSPEHSYPAKLLRMLRERYTGQEVTVLNEGLSGERADESPLRFRAAMSRHRPEVVLLMHGVNDLNGTHDERVQLAVDAMQDLVREARYNGAEPFVATLPPLGPGPKAGCPECVEPYNTRLRGMVSAEGVTLVDVYEAWRGKAGLMGADGIHPTEAGYDVIANTFFEAIRRGLETSSPQ